MVKILISVCTAILISCSMMTIRVNKPVIQKNMINDYINTNGYYLTTYNLNVNKENDFFENKSIVLLKFDEDGFCNVFDIPISKGKTVEETVMDILQRKYTNSPENSGTYNIHENKIIVKYHIFNNPKHLFGKYVSIEYQGIINEKYIQMQTNHGNLKFEFIKKENISFKNYFREKMKK